MVERIEVLHRFESPNEAIYRAFRLRLHHLLESLVDEAGLLRVFFLLFILALLQILDFDVEVGELLAELLLRLENLHSQSLYRGFLVLNHGGHADSVILKLLPLFFDLGLQLGVYRSDELLVALLFLLASVIPCSVLDKLVLKFLEQLGETGCEHWVSLVGLAEHLDEAELLQAR